MSASASTASASPRRVPELAGVLDGALVLVAPAALLMLLVLSTAWDEIGWDFRQAFLPAAHEVWAGRSPFPDAGDPALTHGYAYVYPPLLAFLLGPLALLPEVAATLVAVALLLLAGVVTLYALGVRDLRCYGAAAAWCPVFVALEHTTISLLLALLVALAWRYRDRPALGGAALGVAIALKLFLFPLLVWPLAARRWGMGAATVVSGAVAVLVPWALLGFDDLRRYPEILRLLTDAQRDVTYSIASTMHAAGLRTGLVTTVSVILALALLGWAAMVGRSAEVQSLALCIVAALVLSPIVWLHYLVLLLVPLALARPRFSALWLAPASLWLVVVAGDSTQARALSIPLTVGCMLVVVWASMRHRSFR